jgi:hypothetical protein
MKNDLHTEIHLLPCNSAGCIFITYKVLHVEVTVHARGHLVVTVHARGHLVVTTGIHARGNLVVFSGMKKCHFFILA